MSTPSPSLQPLPPDLVILVVSFAFFYLLDLVHRHHLSPLCRAYHTRACATRFDWDRRAVNLTFQVLQAALNLYLLLLDPHTQRDPLYGYSPRAHLIFLLIIAYYLYDTAALVMHPAPPANTPLWLFHHALALTLLVYDVAYRRVSALPAAAFLISAAGHVSNDARWFAVAAGLRQQRLVNALHLFCALVPLATCGFPPPWLLLRCAAHFRISVAELVLRRMPPYCIFFFALFYVPHLFVIAYQARKAYCLWGTPPKPFHISKTQ